MFPLKSWFLRLWAENGENCQSSLIFDKAVEVDVLFLSKAELRSKKKSSLVKWWESVKMGPYWGRDVLRNRLGNFLLKHHLKLDFGGHIDHVVVDSLWGFLKNHYHLGVWAWLAGDGWEFELEISTTCELQKRIQVFSGEGILQRKNAVPRDLRKGTSLFSIQREVPGIKKETWEESNPRKEEIPKGTEGNSK